mgnify:CR=1 FL=1
MHSLVYQDNSDHFCHFSGQLNISGQIQDINEISGISGISGQVGPLRLSFGIPVVDTAKPIHDQNLKKLLLSDLRYFLAYVTRNPT